jgi:hypothetical protein
MTELKLALFWLSLLVCAVFIYGVLVLEWIGRV